MKCFNVTISLMETRGCFNVHFSGTDLPLIMM